MLIIIFFRFPGTCLRQGIKNRTKLCCQTTHSEHQSTHQSDHQSDHQSSHRCRPVSPGHCSSKARAGASCRPPRDATSGAPRAPGRRTGAQSRRGPVPRAGTARPSSRCARSRGPPAASGPCWTASTRAFAPDAIGAGVSAACIHASFPSSRSSYAPVSPENICSRTACA